MDSGDTSQMGDVNALPTAYGGCTCDCHRVPGVMHCVPCCSHTDEHRGIQANEPSALKLQIKRLEAANRSLLERLANQADLIAAVDDALKLAREHIKSS